MRKNITADEAKSYKPAQGEKLFRRTFLDLSITFNAAKTLDSEERSAIWMQSLEFDDKAIRKEGLRTFYTVVTNHQEPAQRKPLFKRAKVKEYGFHTMRHICASLWIEQGYNPKNVQEMLGHATLAMTMDTYGHLWENTEGRELVNRAEQSLIGTK